MLGSSDDEQRSFKRKVVVRVEQGVRARHLVPMHAPISFDHASLSIMHGMSHLSMVASIADVFQSLTSLGSPRHEFDEGTVRFTDEACE